MTGPPDRLAAPFTGLISFMRVPVCTDLGALDADIAIFGAPTDEGSPWMPGARFAPRTIREMSVRSTWGMSSGESSQGYYDLDEDRHFLSREFRLGRIADCGDADVIYTNVEHTFANITAGVKSILASGAMPVVIGGDHAITFPVVRAYGEPLDIVHFDAHLDYAPFRHGVQFDNGTPIRLAGELSHVGHIVQVGVRGLKNFQPDLQDSKRRGNDVITVREFRHHGADSVFNHLRDGGPVYVSIDVDVLDMPLVPGCSSAEVGGLDYHELKQALSYIAAQHEVVGFDLVEVNPLLDGAARNTSLIGAQLIQEFLGRIVEHPRWKVRHNVATEGPSLTESTIALKA